MGTLEIRLFGVFQIDRDGRSLLRSSSRRVRDLFCYLLLNRDQPQAREQVAGILWGDLDDRRARNCLNTALWRLQTALSESASGTPYLTVDAQRMRVNLASDIWIDVVEFEARCAWAAQTPPDNPEQRAAFYRQAVELYTGDLLVDCFEDWCIIEREHLQHLYLHALGWLLGWHSSTGQLDQAIDCGRRILAIDPLREEVHRDLIQLYLDAGQRAAALRQYRACESAIRRELGVEPMPETRALLQGIVGPVDLPVSQHPAPLHRVRPHDPEVGEDLVAALSRLRDAGSAFDAARHQLAGAVALVEEALRRLDGNGITARPVARPGRMASARAELERATALVAAVVHDLDIERVTHEEPVLASIDV